MNFSEDSFSWGHTSMTGLFVPIGSAVEGNRLCLNTVFHLRNEQAFLISLTGLRFEKYFWLGLSDTEEQGIFRWTSGETPSFTHWNSAMPGKFCMSLTLVIRVWLKFKQISAFYPLVLEVRDGTFVYTAVGDQYQQTSRLAPV